MKNRLLIIVAALSVTLMAVAQKTRVVENPFFESANTSSIEFTRIEVNKELSVIAPAIDSAVKLLNQGGRLAILTFHSLEDRLVKQTFAAAAKGCTCPRNFPVCVCGNKPKLKIITNKPLLPSEEELAKNSRSHSAKLRVAEKL